MDKKIDYLTIYNLLFIYDLIILQLTTFRTAVIVFVIVGLLRGKR